MKIARTALPSVAGVACLALAGLGQPEPQPPVPPSASGVLPTPMTPPVVEQAPPKLSAQELDDLLGPIALYPDPLIAQILPAATYPLEVVQAARWVREHPGLEGLEDQNWDPSVEAVAHYPTVISMMDAKLDWTVRLGQAFLAQQQDVMNSIQQLRARASAAGSLRDTPQQRVVQDQEVIRIVPAQPDVIYVPSYNPQVVYVEPAVGFAVTPYISFGIGFTLGWWLDLDCDWHGRFVYYRRWHSYPYGAPFPHGHVHPHFTPGEVWRRDPHHGPPPVVRPHGGGFPSDAARGRLPSGRPSVPGPAHPGGPGVRPTPGPGQTPSPRPAPNARRAQPVQPAPHSFGGYQRGSQAEQNSQRGQSSRGISPPSVRPGVPPRPAPQAPSAARPTQAPRPAPGIFGGYQSGHDTRSNSQRGNSSRHGRGG